MACITIIIHEQSGELVLLQVFHFRALPLAPNLFENFFDNFNLMCLTPSP